MADAKCILFTPRNSSRRKNPYESIKNSDFRAARAGAGGGEAGERGGVDYEAVLSKVLKDVKEGSFCFGHNRLNLDLGRSCLQKRKEEEVDELRGLDQNEIDNNEIRRRTEKRAKLGQNYQSLKYNRYKDFFGIDVRGKKG